MSRYTLNHQHPQYGPVNVAYGFDQPLGEYFIIVEREPDEDPLFAVASYNTTFPHPSHPAKLNYSNWELLDLFKEFGVPEEHCDSLGMDIPF